MLQKLLPVVLDRSNSLRLLVRGHFGLIWADLGRVGCLDHDANMQLILSSWFQRQRLVRFSE